VSPTRLGRATLLINPPLINGIAFPRQGRCQEREEVLGTTKPPFTLALVAALLRARGAGEQFKLVDLTARDASVADLVADLARDDFRPTLIVFPSTTPTLDADVSALAPLKARYGAKLVCFGPHASTVPAESMARVPQVDAMIVGEPEDALLQLTALGSWDEIDAIPSATYRRGTQVVAARAHGTFRGLAEAPYPAWDLLDLSLYALPLVNAPYVIV